MRKPKAALLSCVIILSLILTGCWNYRETDQMKIVAGIALDKGTEERFEMTVETVNITGGKESAFKSEIFSAEGRTIFEAARNVILTSGRKLYWSHTKVIILSREIANEGITKVLDWYRRDSETREDINILISVSQPAKEILKTQKTGEKIVSFTLNDVLRSQESVGKAPDNDILLFYIETKTKGASSVLPAVSMKENGSEKAPEIKGSAVIKDDKFKAYLNEDETLNLLFIRDEIKACILAAEVVVGKENIMISFEVFRSKTDVKPIVKNGTVRFDITVKTAAALAEEIGEKSLVDEEGIKALEESAECMLKERMESLIRKMQTEYGADIFGFAAKLNEENPKAYKEVSQDWEMVFKELEVNAQVNVTIRNTATIAESAEDGG